MLFNLSDDPGEKVNVAKEQPEVAKRLKAKLDELVAAGRSRPANTAR